MGLATTPLERGDGEWENIQVWLDMRPACALASRFVTVGMAVLKDVLRHAFLDHETQLRRHANRLDGYERHCNVREPILVGRTSCADFDHVERQESIAQWSSVQSLPTHVDRLARVVDSLSEKLKQRAYAYVPVRGDRVGGQELFSY
jgi:hypothetical protein